jgi:adenine-specific DNA glycosylase
MPRRASSPGSIYSVSSGEASDFAPASDPEEVVRPIKRARLSGPKSIKKKVVKDEVDIEDVGIHISRPHSSAYHSTADVAKLQTDLLAWFEEVREKRGMPWRKRYDPELSMQEKGQRAYEIWVSEVMLQQTQVNTVIAYWQRWIEKWPTIGDLAGADIEDVGTHISRPHSSAYHSTADVAKLQTDLLTWFEEVREKRGMPWRKRYDPELTMEEKGQRAYEIWVSEVMLQQTQVNTVIAYWQRWIEKWPTIGDLAGADIEEVNAAWRESFLP